MARLRVRESGYHFATGKWLGNPISKTRDWSSQHTCSDAVGPQSDHACTITHKVLEGGLVVAQISPQTYYDGMPATYNWGTFLSAPSLTIGNYGTRVLAGTGPLTPRVNLPLFLLELKDLPAMLKHAGDLLHGLKRPHKLSPDKEAAAATLAWQFGWGPLLQDLGKLLDFSDAVRKTQRNLKNAATTRGLKRRIPLDSDNRSQHGDEVVWSVFGLNINQKYYGYKSFETWATVRWKLRDTNGIGREPTYNEAFKTAMGLNPGQIPITIWKALPWTWMIDWFADISSSLQASYNIIYYKPTNLCIMRHSKNEWFYQPYYVGAKLYCTEAHVVHEEKRRIISFFPNAALTLKLPFLDNFKLSILGSLTVLRIRGR